MTLLTTPRPFQVEGADQLMKWGGRGLLADQMGLGKSLQCLMCLERNPSWLPALVVCPAHLKENWAREAEKHIGMKARILSTTTCDMGRVENQQILICNYNILMYWLFVLQAAKLQTVIADEAHALANPETNQTWAMKELVETVPHFIAVSGTPITSRPIQFWPVLNMIDREAWPSRHRFGHRYGAPRRNPFSGGWEFKGCTNGEELNQILTNKYMIRRLKEDVLKDLPAKMYNTVPLELKKAELKEYNLAKNDLKSWIKANVRADSPGAVRAEALQKVNVLRQLTSRLKIPHVIDWVKGFLESGEKLILYGVHRDFVAAIHKAFGKQSVMVRGDTPMGQRQEAFDRFNRSKDCKLFVGNVQAAGTGWSATSCSNVAFGEFSWVPSDLTQGVDRAHGIGRGQQGIPTAAWFLTAAATADEKFLKILKEKEKNIGTVMDGKDWAARTDSIFEDVMKDLMLEDE
jgi:SWI/SNF-related matrix-associated actin-dependent regulator 1 of chromatin subfamily A